MLDKLENEVVGKGNRPLNPLTIDNVTIHANPIADKEDLEARNDKLMEVEAEKIKELAKEAS